MAKQEIIEKILASAQAKIDSEVSGLLGAQLKTAKAENRICSRADFFKPVEKLVLTTLKVDGELTGEAFLAVSLNAAILMGGTLIMLPEAELEKHITSGIFGDDEKDAFGEIANIIAGVYSASFDEFFPQKIRLYKASIAAVEPAKIDLASDSPFPEQPFYVSSSAMEMAGKKIGALQILLPAELFGLAVVGLKAASSAAAAPEAATERASETASEPVIKAAAESATEATTVSGAASQQPMPATDSTLVLVISENDETRELFVGAIQSCGFTARCLDFVDNVKEAVAGAGVRGVFLIMEEVSEQGVAAIIKTRSACGAITPLIAAGPQWTRNTVLQAVKYGVCDIIVMPTAQEEIQEKVLVHLGENPAGVGSDAQ
jgi:chemotaxis protein CheY-P-specific phosphatase CheC